MFSLGTLQGDETLHKYISIDKCLYEGVLIQVLLKVNL